MPLAKLPSFASSFTDTLKIRWPWSNSSVTSSHARSQSSWASESGLSQSSSAGARRRRSACPQSSGFHSREISQTESQGTSQARSSISYPSENQQSSSSRSGETEGFPRTYQDSSYATERTRNERSDQSYGQSFTISSRLKRAILAPTKLQTIIGFVILIIVVASIVIGLVLGLRNISLQDRLRNRINTIPVRVPNFNESIIGHIKGEPPQKREFFFVIDERLGSPDGVEKAMIVANGQYPGPIVEVNQDDEVVINVKNNLSQPTSIHWQGLLQSGTNHFDGIAGVTECGIPAGEQMSYRLKPGSYTGTTFWKAGYGTQAPEGLTGGLVVHPTHTSTTVTYDEEILIHLSDLYHENSKVLTEKYISADGLGGKPGNEPVPDSGTINGIGQYPHRPNGEIIFPLYHKVVVEKSRSYRLRLVNAGSMAPIIFSVDSHNLTVIESDGVEVEPVTFTGGIQIEVGQRYSVVLHADHEEHEQFWMRAVLVADQFKYDNPEAVHEILGIVAYGEGTEGVPHLEDHKEPIESLDSSRLRPLVPISPPPATQTYTVDYSLGQSSPGGSTVGSFNATSWIPLLPSSSLLTNLGDGKDGPSVPSPYQFLLSADKPEVIDLIINNLSGGSSTFSLSGHRPWIMGTGVGNYHGDGPQAVPSTNMTNPTSNGASIGSTPSNNMNSSTSLGPSTGLASNNPGTNATATSPSSSSSSPAPSLQGSSSPTPNLQGNHSGSSAPDQTPTSNGQKTSSFNSVSRPNKYSSKKAPQYYKEKKKYGTSYNHHKHHKSFSKDSMANIPSQSSPPSTSHHVSMHELEVHEPYKVAYSGYWGKENIHDYDRSQGWKKDSNDGDKMIKVRRQLPKSDNQNLIQSDVFTIPKDGWVKIRFLTDNPGMWLLSDQNQWHLAAGGAMQLQSRKAEWPAVPDEVKKFCLSPEKLMR